LTKELGLSHHKFYKNVRGQKKETEAKHEDLNVQNYSGGQVMARKIRNSYNSQQRRLQMGA
jgi:hypothetical protein